MGNYMFISLFLAFLSMNIVVVYGFELTPRCYDIYIYDVNITKLCHKTVTLTANGTVPGPTIHANKGETVYVNVHNNGTRGITIHWHGILQPRNPWYDGPMNITQCPIPSGSNFTYELIFSREEGTIWYHAHSEWSMATVHGAIVVRPPHHKYPYKFDGEQEIILGTWYIQEVMKMYDTARANGNEFPRANATTINGQPGYPNSCSAVTSFQMTVRYGKTYLLRVVNAVLNEDQFFGIAGHKLTLVGHDGAYTKSLTSDYIRIAPGQTMDVLFTANRTPRCYYMAAAPYFPTGNPATFTNTTTSALLRYRGASRFIIVPTTIPYPKLPAIDNTTAAEAFTNAIRSLNSAAHPAVVPKNITKYVTIEAAAGGHISGAASAALNNISFKFPSLSVLQAYSRNLSGYFEEDFPSRVEDSPAEMVHGTKALMFDYSDEVQIVFSRGVHPMHIHGFTFYAVANGTGAFVADNVTACTKTTAPGTPCYNLVDPPELTTVSIPNGGWVAIRFVADNPGVWFVHCHYERHLSEGMATVFIVRNGTTKAESMLPTPDYMPPCTCSTGETCLSSAPIKEKGLFRPFASI